MDGETPTTGVQICEGVGSRRRHVFYSRLTMLSWLLYVCFDPQKKKKLYVCFELVWTSWFAEQEIDEQIVVVVFERDDRVNYP